MRTNKQAAYSGRIYAARNSEKKALRQAGSAWCILHRHSIEDRPAIVETRSRISDWEADTIIGEHHRQATVSMVERKSIFTLMCKVERKTAQAVAAAMTAQAVAAAMTALLKPYRSKVHTVTSDNGREFAGHEKIAKELKADLDRTFAACKFIGEC